MLHAILRGIEKQLLGITQALGEGPQQPVRLYHGSQAHSRIAARPALDLIRLQGE